MRAQELRRKLARHDFDAEQIVAVLDDLEHDGSLSDQRFSEQYAQARRGRGYGPVRIREELRQRGVEDTLASDAVMLSDPDWRACAEAARRRKFAGDPPRKYRDRARQARFLRISRLYP